ncbi:aspartyl-tRNA(Asn)/glutamyl-tRNA(Gln) amidotransferase subunit A [Promicromonospora sp. AC04]|uniref:amidase n=1 Tax=Promicromonospora sp. AC04 TaxID=2135723 RepID=UPI000D3C7F10|nr:amidase [Promicromonospora sp. AC04]PUB24848.1 aspartyl-tRNA(Asn)/glutamyl-tRNA(Gln) amidotransferase subunit A [Promicromonospora sp. AC04]
MRGLLDLSVAEVAAGLRRREYSVVDVVSASLTRIEETTELAAYVDVYADRALKIAQAHQTLLGNGIDLGPLHGVPIAVKDNVDVEGTLTAAGSRILQGNFSEEDATVVARLRKQGAIIVGTTNLHEFAWGGTTDNPHFGRTRNPWDLSRSPAGSSGGSGAAVAARTVFAALGTDTGGSVRLPASMNGVTGIRPGIGRVSNAGVYPLAWSLDTVGPLAGSAQDCAVLLDAMSGRDARDPQSYGHPTNSLAAMEDRGLRGARIGVISGVSRVQLQPAVLDAFDSTLALLERLGASVREIEILDLEAVVDALVIVDAVEPSAHHAPWLRSRPGDYGADVRANLEAGLVIPAVDYVQAQRYRAHVRRQFSDAFDQVDVLLTPTLPFTAPGVGQTTITIDSAERDVLTSLMRFTALASVPGLPAMSLPIGFDADGLPIGLQVIGAPDDEAGVLRLGAALQSQTDWHQRRPSLA